MTDAESVDTDSDRYYHSRCGEYHPAHYQQDTEGLRWNVAICPPENLILVNPHPMGELTKLYEGENNPMADLKQLEDADDRDSSLVETDAAEELGLDREQAIERDDVAVVPNDTDDIQPDESERPEKSLVGQMTDEGEHMRDEAPLTITELRELVPDLIAELDPDEDTEILYNASHTPDIDGDFDLPSEGDTEGKEESLDRLREKFPLE